MRNHVPDGGYANLEALGVVQQASEELEEAIKVVFETLDNVVEHGVENVDADFTVRGLLGGADRLQERQQLRPGAVRELNVGDGRNNARDRVTDKVAVEKRVKSGMDSCGALTWSQQEQTREAFP